MDEILRSLHGCKVRSIRGKFYSVSVYEGQHVTLGHAMRDPSVLPWDQIELVYKAACSGMPITTKNVDDLRGDHPATRDASTMCALILAMRDPSRVLQR